jgi:hypothetical protein
MPRSATWHEFGRRQSTLTRAQSPSRSRDRLPATQHRAGNGPIRFQEEQVVGNDRIVGVTKQIEISIERRQQGCQR